MNRTFTLRVFLLIVCCHWFSANAQQAPVAHKPDKKRYVIVQVGTDMLPFYNNRNSGLMGIRFPYSIADASGLSDSVFSVTKQLFSKHFLAYIYPVDIEIGTEKHFFSTQLFSTRTQNNSFAAVTVDYGRNFYFDGFNKHPGNSATSSFVLKPSISISYSQNGRSGNINKTTSLAQIDNTGKSISMLGAVADSNFDVSTSDYDPNTDVTTTTTANYNSQTLLINFIHQEWSVVPKIAVASNQNKHPFHWEIYVGYRIAVSDEDGIGLYQTAPGDNANMINPFINLYNKNTTVTYNNTIITKSPYNFSGLFFGFTIGWTISKKFPLKKA